MRTPFHLLLVIAAIAAFSFAPSASAVNIVTNGGFETGNFTGWMQSGDTSFTGVAGGIQNSGSFAAFFGPTSSFGYITQTLTTMAGATYNFSFWLANGTTGGGNGPSGGNGPNGFTASWNGGMPLVSLTNAAPFGYTQYSFSVTATGTSTDIVFGFYNVPSFWYLDDVSVELASAGVPESISTLWLALPLLGMIGFPRLRRRQA